jgi:4-amino-4-deoxy-L-arabinose transferase-like glycosyltransferase
MIWRSPRGVFAAIALALTLAPLAASAPLFDPDEGLHAAIAQEMVLRGDYVTPTFLGEPFLDKPILFFWSEAASLRVFGMNAAAIRVPPLLFGVLGMIAVAALGRSLFGETAGLLAGICYGSMLLPLGVSEVAVHDVALAPFICVAALALFSAAHDGRAVSRGLIAGLALGLSVLTKGLVGIAFAGLFAIAIGAVNRPAIPRLVVVLAVALPIAAAVAAPWYLAMEHAHPGYLHYYFIERHLHGFMTATQRHSGRPWWYYAPILVGGSLPWTVYIFGALAFIRSNRLMLVLGVWLTLGFLFLSAAESKLVTYALPLFIPIALLVGEYVANQLRQADQRKSGLFGFAFGAHAVVLALLPLGALLMVSRRFAVQPGTVWILATAAALVVLAVAWTARRSMSPTALLAGYAGMTIVSASVLLIAIVPRAAEWMTARDLAGALNESPTLPPRVLVLDERIGSVIFYLSPALRAQAAPDRFADVSLAQLIARLRIDPPDTIVAVRDTRDRLGRLFAGRVPSGRTAGTFTLYRADQLRLR